MSCLTQLNSWKELEQLAATFRRPKINDSTQYLSSPHIILDYTAQSLDEMTRRMLLKLAFECALEPMIDALFAGEEVNFAEKKPALHTALRMPQHTQLWINNHNIIPDINTAKDRMRAISNDIRAGRWLGFTQKPITDIVNIGIGGSHLGPAFCMHAFMEQTLDSLSYHFISDMDPLAFKRVTSRLNPETTLFIVSSKSFTTAETLYNLKKAIAWMNHPDALDKHFIAVTAHPKAAYEWGIQHVLPIWDWVGGRYSICSAINLITCIAIGFDSFMEFLEGAYEMDEHFRQTPLEHNLPVQLALFGIWNNNFLKMTQLLLLTYGHSLDYFAPYIQQLDMESNGKSIDAHGQPVHYATGPIVWGGSGNQAQHSYYQLLCQGTHALAVDLISVDAHHDSPLNHLCAAQKEVLSQGSLDAKDSNSFIPGNTPINHIRLRDDSAKTIGALIALYEHKIYTQSVIWRINAFDQPGVESSKRLMKKGLSYV